MGSNRIRILNTAMNTVFTPARKLRNILPVDCQENRIFTSSLALLFVTVECYRCVYTLQCTELCRQLRLEFQRITAQQTQGSPEFELRFCLQLFCSNIELGRPDLSSSLCPCYVCIFIEGRDLRSDSGLQDLRLNTRIQKMTKISPSGNRGTKKVAPVWTTHITYQSLTFLLPIYSMYVASNRRQKLEISPPFG